MIDVRHRVFVWAGIYLMASWGSLAFIDWDRNGGLSEVIGLGYLFGSLFGHATLAASWAAYGPGRALWRVPLSLGWVLLLGVAVGINMGLHGGPNEAPLIIGTCYLAQWLVLQLPLWGLKSGFRSRLSYVDDELTGGEIKWQFGIRQLLIVTTIVGMVFGMGRLMIGPLSKLFDGGRGEPLMFLFLAMSAIVFALPLLVAALLKRWTVAGVIMVLFMIGVATIWEASLLRSNITGIGSRPNVYDLFAINTFTSIQVLVVATIVRCCGYALTRSQSVKAA